MEQYHLNTEEKENNVTAKTKNKHSSFKLRVVTVLLALAMLFSVATFSACNSSNNENNSDNNQTNSGQTNTDNSGDSNNSDDTNNSGSSSDPLDQYSDIVKYVVNNSEMDNLLARAEVDNSLYDTPLFDPHPYTFLEEQGHDVEKVKSGDLSCRTVSYVDPDEPNNLYMMTYVENAADSKCTVNYYTEYLLKYTLTDQEITDYKNFHKLNDDYDFYIQAVFLNEAISATKPVQIVNKQEITVSAHTNLCDRKTGVAGAGPAITDPIGSTSVDILLKDFDEESQTFNIYVYKYMSNNKSMASKINIGILPLRSGLSNLIVENNIFLGPNKYGQFDLGTDLTSYKENIKSVSAYSSQNTMLASIFSNDFEDKLYK